MFVLQRQEIMLNAKRLSVLATWYKIILNIKEVMFPYKTTYKAQKLSFLAAQ